MIKTLWFAGNPAMYANRNSYNGGGWIASLQRHLLKNHRNAVEISIAFPWNSNIQECVDGCRYYGISSIKKPWFRYKSKENARWEYIKSIIEMEKPDIILVFGTETPYGQICSMTDVPVVVHIQGMLNSYYETWMPQGLSWSRYLCSYPKVLKCYKTLIGTFLLKRNCIRELGIYKKCKYFFGRTEWDKGLVELLAPQAKYFYCSEMLRPSIIDSSVVWSPPRNARKRIVSVISDAVYKGEDVILRTAKILNQHYSNSIEWVVYGIGDISYWERLTGICHESVNVQVKGVVSAEELVEVLASGDVYVHPSYIENSPNTVCEAQLIGIPVIATNVGGTSSLIKHGESGFLVPANDVFSLASVIKKVLSDELLSVSLGQNGRKVALDRHSPDSISTDLIENFKKIIADN